MSHALTFTIGVAMCFVSALLSVLGVNLQKRVHQKNEIKPPEEQRLYFRTPMWWMGMSGVVFGALLDFMSLGFAPQTVVAAFGAATLVINAWTAPFFLNEKLSLPEFGATMLIALGAILVVVMASHNNNTYTLDQLIELFERINCMVYFVVIVCLGIALYSLFVTLERRREAIATNYSPRMHAISIASVSGIVGAQSLLFAKAVMLILKQSIDPAKPTPFKKWEAFVITIALAICIVTQTHTLNTALSRFDAIFVLPIFQVSWIISGVIGAGVFYDEFESLHVYRKVLLLLGFVVIAYGIFLLARRHLTPEVLEDPQTGVTGHMGAVEGLAVGLLAHRGMPVLDSNWYAVYERSRGRADRAVSADLGDLRRTLYKSPHQDHSTTEPLVPPHSIGAPFRIPRQSRTVSRFEKDQYQSAPSINHARNVGFSPGFSVFRRRSSNDVPEGNVILEEGVSTSPHESA